MVAGSHAGYRAREKWAQLLSPHEAVARTERLAGWLSVTGDGSALRADAGCFAVDLRELQSVDTIPGQRMSDRDENVRGFLDTDHHPTARYRPHAVDLPGTFVSGQVTRIDGDIEVQKDSETRHREHRDSLRRRLDQRRRLTSRDRRGPSDRAAEGCGLRLCGFQDRRGVALVLRRLQ
jgi:hypothetical protein